MFETVTLIFSRVKTCFDIFKMIPCNFLTIGCIFRKRSTAELSSLIDFSCSLIFVLNCLINSLSVSLSWSITRNESPSPSPKTDTCFVDYFNKLEWWWWWVSFIIIDSDGCFLLCDGCTLCHCSLYLNWVQLLRFFSAFSHWWQAIWSYILDCILWNDPSPPKAMLLFFYLSAFLVVDLCLFPLLFPNIVTVLVSLWRNQCEVLGPHRAHNLFGTETSIEIRRHCWSRCI